MEFVEYADDDLESLRSLHVERGGYLTWREICETYNLNISAEALRKKVHRYESRTALQRYKLNEKVTNVDTNSQIEALQQEINRLRMLFKESHNSNEMYVPYPVQLNDCAAWENWRDNELADKGVVSVMILSDIHFPDHSETALRLAKKLVAAAKPDVLLHNGDIFDFDALSTFAKSRRRVHRDVLHEVEEYWHKLVDDLVTAAPNTRQIAYRGNHDSRLDRWNDATSSPFADTNEEAFVRMVRSENRVWWLGQYQETNVGGLLAQHGKRAGENAARGAIKDFGWAASMVQGHTHRPDLHVHRVNNPRNPNDYRVVTSAVVGPLCNIPPAYVTDTKQSTWIHSVGYAHVNMDGDDVNLQNLIFQRRRDGVLWTVLGTQVITSE
jgi:predicted phosphodiesterase